MKNLLQKEKKQRDDMIVDIDDLVLDPVTTKIRKLFLSDNIITIYPHQTGVPFISQGVDSENLE